VRRGSHGLQRGKSCASLINGSLQVPVRIPCMHDFSSNQRARVSDVVRP